MSSGHGSAAGGPPHPRYAELGKLLNLPDGLRIEEVALTGQGGSPPGN